MNIRRTIALTIASLAVVAGCANPPHSGTITQKTYRAPYTWYSHHCVTYSKNGLCMISVPVPHHVPAAYGLCLKADPQDTSTDQTGCIAVDQTTYDRYGVGQRYGEPR